MPGQGKPRPAALSMCTCGHHTRQGVLVTSAAPPLLPLGYAAPGPLHPRSEHTTGAAQQQGARTCLYITVTTGLMCRSSFRPSRHMAVSRYGRESVCAMRRFRGPVPTSTVCRRGGGAHEDGGRRARCEAVLQHSPQAVGGDSRRCPVAPTHVCVEAVGSSCRSAEGSPGSSSVPPVTHREVYHRR